MLKKEGVERLRNQKGRSKRGKRLKKGGVGEEKYFERKE